MTKLLRHLILAPLALLLLAGMAQAQQLPLSEISRYLDSFRTAQAEFTQINPDGTISTGTLYIKRPGRIRFEYAPPEEALVMAGGGSVAVFDPRSNTGPERYPLSQTPLKIILARDIDLGRENMVVAHGYDGQATTVTTQDPENPHYGNIQLRFTANPTELRQWVITDDAGQQTTVVLGDLTTGVEIGDLMFNIQSETRRRGG